MAALRLLLVAVLLALPLWVAQTGPAQACVCAPFVPDTSYEAFLADRAAQADLIVVGEIGEMLVLPPESVAHLESRGSATPVEIKFLVSDSLKGSAPNPVLVYNPAYTITQEDGRITRIAGTSCDIIASVGDTYVMFLRKIDTLRYATGACSGNRSLDLQIPDGTPPSEYLAEIRAAIQRGPGLPPTGSGAAHDSAPLVPLIAASALASLGLAANAAFALRRRSS